MASFANASRGLRIKDTDFEYFTEGAYGVVFVDRKTGRLRKVYRRKPDAPADHSQETFEAETRAFEIASTSDELKALIPEWYGRLPTQLIVDAQGNDVSGEFLCDLAFEIEFIDGDFQKFGLINPEEFERVRGLFARNGIRYLIDMSVVFRENRVYKAIDFATHEVEL